MSEDRWGTLKVLEKAVANLSNEHKRHCVIGKVTPKPKRPYDDISQYGREVLSGFRYAPPKDLSFVFNKAQSN